MHKKVKAFLGRSSGAALVALMVFAGLGTGASTPPGSRDIDGVLADLEGYALATWDPGEVPGFAYAVVHGGETVYARGFGTRSQDPASGPVDERTLFEIGSCTKAFNAAVLGTVVDEGRVAWSDRVRDHLGSFKMRDRWVTREFLVEDLMAQRSGMPAYALDTMSFMGFGRRDIMRAVRFVEPVSSFRSTFGYQNNLHLWAAALVEEKAGLPWEEAVGRRLLEPLGMDASTFDFRTYDADPNHAMAHIPLEEGGLWTIPADWPYRGWLSVYAPAGGLMSNAVDMAKWVAFQLGDGSFGGRVILRPETVRAIRAPRIFQASGSRGVSSYAMGWVFMSSPETPWYLHDGETAGMHSIVALYPQAGLGLVVLTNQAGNTLPERLALKLLELYFGAGTQSLAELGLAGFAPFRHDVHGEAEGQAAEALPPGKLVGTYENPAYGKAVVTREGGVLRLTLGPARHTGELVPEGRNRYIFSWPGWPGSILTATFRADASGEVAKMNIEQFGDVRGGDFVRRGR